MKLNIVLLEPEIPHNTGAIGRTCVATNTSLHLIKPLGFGIDDKSVKRAGLDYWDDLDVHEYENYEDFLSKNPNATVYRVRLKLCKLTPMLHIKKMTLLCSEKRVRGFLKRFYLQTKKIALEFLC